MAEQAEGATKHPAAPQVGQRQPPRPEGAQGEAVPAAADLATARMGLAAPADPGAGPQGTLAGLRQRRALQMQRVHGNAFVQRNLRLSSQQLSVQRTKVDDLRGHLEDGRVEPAISLMGTMTREESNQVLRRFREQATSAFDNEEMGRAMMALDGDLKPSLQWMFAEGTDWLKVRTLLRHNHNEPADVLANAALRGQFGSLCSETEMVEAVELLGATLLESLQWMLRGGTSWPLVRQKILQWTDDGHRRLVRESPDMKRYFCGLLGNDEMYEAVQLLGGDIVWKVNWMVAEGTDWPHVRALISGASPTDRATLRAVGKAFFVALCDNREMADAVELLGGSLAWKLEWLVAEGTSWPLIRSLLVSASEADKRAVREEAGQRPTWQVLSDQLTREEMAQAADLLGGDLKFRLKFMKAGGSTWGLVRAKLIACTDPTERSNVLADTDIMRWLSNTICDADQLAEANTLLGSGATATALTPEAARQMNWPTLRARLLALSPAAKDDIRPEANWRRALVSVCGNDEMAEAVDILGGSLDWKLTWMQAEGTDYDAVAAKVRATTNAEEKRYVRDNMRDFFVDVCNTEQMAQMAELLGGNLSWKLDWMLAEGTNAGQILAAVNRAPQAERDALVADWALWARVRGVLGEEAAAAIQGLGPAAAASFAIEQGGPANLVEALRIVATSPAPATLVQELRTAGKWDTFLDTCPRGSELTPVSRGYVDTLYSASNPNDAERRKLIRIRYRLSISGAGIMHPDATVGWQPPTPWGTTQLDRVYEVLGELPEGWVSGNQSLQTLHLVVSGIGTFYSGYRAIHLPSGAGYTGTETWPAAVPENHFRGTIRHEVGHAIDDAINGREWYMNAPEVDWDEWATVDGWLASMEAAGGWGAAPADKREQIRQVIRAHYANPGASTAFPAPADPNHPFNQYPTCPIVRVATETALEGSHDNYATMVTIGGKIYMRRPGYQAFYAYKQAARDAPMFISAYGLSAPGEWFAEQLREYFRPGGGVVAPFVRTWFRTHLP